MTVFGFYLLTLLVVPGYRICSASSSPMTPTTPTSTTTTTSQPKQAYGSHCNMTVLCDDDNMTVSCNSIVAKCLCVDGRYRNGGACIYYTSLSPNLTKSATVGTNNITVTWTAEAAINYTDMYYLNISRGGVNVHNNSTDKNSYTFVGLEQGTAYDVSLVRTITRFERSQNLPAISQVYRTGVGYNQTCTENDICIDNNASCEDGRCRCDLGFYRKDTTCVSIDDLKPTSINVSVDNTTSMTATWESPTESVVTGYEVSVTSYSSHRNFTVGTTTTPITELTPGRLYNVSVQTRIRYLQGRDETTTALLAEPKVTTPATVDGLGNMTNLHAPDITIDFHKAVGDVDSYLIQLLGTTDGSYNCTNTVNASVTITIFNDIVPNNQYTLTITTQSNQQQSAPYIQDFEAKASQSGAVEDFEATTFTSRTVAVSWKRPVNTSGDLFQYRLEVFNGTCKQRIIFNCTECKGNASTEAGEKCDTTTSVGVSESDINNASHEVNYTITGLLPDTVYNVTVAAYNQAGPGVATTLPVSTKEEAAGKPTDLTVNGTTSNSITVTWRPPEPRPGNTHYNISVYEKNENTSVYEYIDTKGIPGYDHTNYTVNNLSSFWEYKLYIEAFTQVGGYGNVSSGVVTTKESAPSEVVQYVIGEGANVYNTRKLSWQCPKQKDGRNGKIISSTLVYHTNQTSTKSPKRGNMTYDNTNDCKWEIEVEVTPQFFYSFTVFLHNTFAGAQSTQHQYIEAGPPDLGSVDVGLIVGAAASTFVCAIVIVLLIWFIRRGRNAGTDERDLSAEETSNWDDVPRKRPVKISEFEQHVYGMHKDSNLLFSAEFEEICTLSPKHACKASEFDSNRLRNRYVNILPFDHTRVKLRSLSDDDEDETDYINANYIPGRNSPREYIATQGPMVGTVADFWRMIWEQEVNIIIMLSDLLEKGKPKVDLYWPETINEPVQHGEIIVEMINYSPLNKYVIKIFRITKGDESRKVRHYFLPGWQDFGANLTSENVISFVRDVRMTKTPTDKGPICVHCSAGVGRTGTYISLDVFKQAIDEENFDKELDVFDFVMKMRENRSYMVQTEKQYIFIHDTIREMITNKKKEIAERENIYENCGNDPENVYANQAFEPDPEELYINVKPGQPTTEL